MKRLTACLIVLLVLGAIPVTSGAANYPDLTGVWQGQLSFLSNNPHPGSGSDIQLWVDQQNGSTFIGTLTANSIFAWPPVDYQITGYIWGRTKNSYLVYFSGGAVVYNNIAGPNVWEVQGQALIPVHLRKGSTPYIEGSFLTSMFYPEDLIDPWPNLINSEVRSYRFNISLVVD